jgi:hypothetical protein
MHAGLDPLYRQVVSSARSTDSFDRVIGTIIVLRYRLPVKQLGLLLKLETSDIRAALEGLESVCKIPQDDKEGIQPFHASLYDFFADSERSKEFFVDPVAHHSSVLLDCLRIITGDLKEGEIDEGWLLRLRELVSPPQSRFNAWGRGRPTVFTIQWLSDGVSEGYGIRVI